MDSVSLPLRIPYILRAGIIITLGIGAWAIAAWACLTGKGHKAFEDHVEELKRLVPSADKST